jgi:hypothetical protein
VGSESWFSGRSVYRTTIRTGDPSGLKARLEALFRAKYEPEGFDVKVRETHGTYFLELHRGLTAGFTVGLIPMSGPSPEQELMVGLGRSSRLDGFLGWIAAGIAILAGVAAAIGFQAAGVPLPPLVFGLAVLAAMIVTLLVVLQLATPVVAALEHLAGGRLDDAAIGEPVELLKRTIEENVQIRSAD